MPAEYILQSPIDAGRARSTVCQQTKTRRCRFDLLADTLDVLYTVDVENSIRFAVDRRVGVSAFGSFT